MTFLPIAERELRVRARHKATFRTRIGAALAACLIIGFFLLGSRVSPAGIGRTVFWFVSVLAFIWCLCVTHCAFAVPHNNAPTKNVRRIFMGKQSRYSSTRNR